ncbi:MAG TPA: IscS subfamily cysteine desulfurase [Sedimentisphaerales bacterium]|nr:IscS subfamily cysteine desulfurase [Sedimentisphaerales bacterium]
MLTSIYVDHAATTPVDPRVLEAMRPFFMSHFGNPSSAHSVGAAARQAIEKARSRIAELISAAPEEVYFTSGGTEADNLAMKGYSLANSAKGRHIIVSSIEHHAVLHSAETLHKLDFEVSIVPVDGFGYVDPQDVKRALRKDTILISVMHANNEVGTLQDVAEIGRIAKEAGIIFHTDAVQTAGSIPVDVNELGVDMLSLSAHKFYGPKGIGALYVRNGIRIIPLLDGGAQEHGFRAGTENVPAIVGMGVAAQLAQMEMASRSMHISQLRDLLIDDILHLDPNIALNGHRQKRLPGNVSICLGKTPYQESLEALNSKGICASTGSACTSHAAKPSHVLTAMGIPPEKAMSVLRFTFGKANTETDVEGIVEELHNIMKSASKPFRYVSTTRDSAQIRQSSEDKATITVDVRGFYCPVPVLKTKEVFDSMTIGDTLQVIADDPAAESDLQNWITFTGQRAIGVQRRDSEICFLIKKIGDIL